MFEIEGNKLKRAELLFPEESYKIVGCCMEVHKELGPGFLEKVYQEALEYEFKKIYIPYLSEQELTIKYKNYTLQQKYFVDFVCYEKILLELKAVKDFDDIHKAQLFNYLKATGFKLGILINFGKKSLVTKRIVL
ncbi:MAG: GxxExxY protein [bacterium]